MILLKPVTYSTFSLWILCLCRCWSYSGHQMLILCVEFLEESRIYVHTCLPWNKPCSFGWLKGAGLAHPPAFCLGIVTIILDHRETKISKWNSVILIFLGCQPGQFSLSRTVGVPQTLSGVVCWGFLMQSILSPGSFHGIQPAPKMWLINRCGGTYPIENPYNPEISPT